MLDYSQKKKTRKFMYSMPVLVFLFVVFCFLADKVFVLYQKESDVREKATEASANLSSLEAREKILEKKVDFLKTERGKEQEMRSRFMVGKAGEGVIMVVDEKPTTTGETNGMPKYSWWSGFLNFFR